MHCENITTALHGEESKKIAMHFAKQGLKIDTKTTYENFNRLKFLRINRLRNYIF